MGGSLLSRHLAADPGDYSFRSLTLIASGGFSPDNEYRRAMMEYDCTREGMKAMLRGMFVDPRWTEDPAYVERRYELSIRPGAWETIAAARFKNPLVPPRALFGRPDDTAYENIRIPTLVIAGSDDKLRLEGYAEELAARIPQAQLKVLGGCGHCPHIERAQEVNAALLAFFQSVDATAPQPIPPGGRPDSTS
jgi:pimeloyl-ACP methyl ester carboxylesterase